MARVAVIGAGTMGHAIALVYALGGHQVRLTDSNMMTLDKAQGLMEAALATLVEGGEAPPDWTSAHLAQMVTRHFSLEETVEGAELIIEAIVETPNAKAALYRQLEACAPAEAIIASNTSQLDVFPLVPESLQSRTMIAHWYTPPYLVDLVDIIAGPHCEPARVDKVEAMLADAGAEAGRPWRHGSVHRLHRREGSGAAAAIGPAQ
jgi:3-hydroxybutyryl-CoA dehydrogenase